jgi:hypothetical protein
MSDGSANVNARARQADGRASLSLVLATICRARSAAALST